MKIKNFLLGMFAISNMSIFAENIHNPVLPNVADAGVLRYNGKYYIAVLIHLVIFMFQKIWLIGKGRFMS